MPQEWRYWPSAGSYLPPHLRPQVKCPHLVQSTAIVTTVDHHRVVSLIANGTVSTTRCWTIRLRGYLPPGWFGRVQVEPPHIAQILLPIISAKYNETIGHRVIDHR